MRAPRERSRGFTLVELMVALAVFAVMSAMAYGGLSSVIEARTQIDRALARMQDLQMTVHRLQSDLGQVAARRVRDEFGDLRPAIAAEPSVGLVFTRLGWRNPLDEPRSHLQRVRYRLDEEGNLVRSHWRVLDRAQDSAPVETVLLENVERVEWRFLDGEREWQDQWPPLAFGGSASGLLQEDGTGEDEGDDQDGATPQQEIRLPVAVELRLTTEEYGEIRQLFAIAGAQR